MAIETSARADDKQACWAMIDTAVDRACACFAKVAAESRTPDVLVDWGKCERRRGNAVDALRLYEEARPHYEGTPEVSTRLQQEIDRIHAELGRIAIGLRASVKLERPRVTIDGKPSTLGETWVVPGAHEVQVFDGERRVDTTTVEVAAGAMVTLEIPRNVPAGPAVVPPPVVPAPEESGGLHPITITGSVLLAVGGVGVVGAAITGGMMLDAYGTAKDGGCPRCDGEARDAAERGASLEGINTASWVVAIAGVVTGVSMIVVGETALSPDAPTVAVGVGPSGGWVRGTF